MCRANVSPETEGPLAELILEMRDKLADSLGHPREQVTIGPIDLGEFDDVGAP